MRKVARDSGGLKKMIQALKLAKTPEDAERAKIEALIEQIRKSDLVAFVEVMFVDELNKYVEKKKGASNGE